MRIVRSSKITGTQPNRTVKRRPHRKPTGRVHTVISTGGCQVLRSVRILSRTGTQPNRRSDEQPAPQTDPQSKYRTSNKRKSGN